VLGFVLIDSTHDSEGARIWQSYFAVTVLLLAQRHPELGSFEVQICRDCGDKVEVAQNNRALAGLGF
jgi:hypothetical protein